MTMYKIQRDPIDGSENMIFRKSDNTFIPRNVINRDYQQFVNDIYKKGIGIVEGADYVGVTTYTEARAAEYPPIVDQLDKIYHEGIDAWKADIKAIKDKYPKTQVGITSIAPIPDWVKTILFDKQKEKYVEAKTRLEQYELANGLKGVVDTKKVWKVAEVGSSGGFYVDEDVIGYIIEPLPIEVDGERNLLVVQDEAERQAAQAVINNTPQAVIDSINT